MSGLDLLFSEHARCSPTRRPDDQPGLDRAVAQYFLHVVQRYRYAASRRSVILPREVKENGASPALDAGPLIVAGFHHNIIEMIGTFQVLVGRGIGQVYPPVVVSVAHPLAPAPAAADRQKRDFRQGPKNMVIPVIHLTQLPDPDGTGAVALPLEAFPAGSSQGAAHRKGATGENPPGCTRADRANVKICDCFPHGLLSCPRTIKRPLNILELPHPRDLAKERP